MECPEKIEHELLRPEFRIRPRMYNQALGEGVLSVMDFLKARGDEFIIISHPRTGIVIFTRQNPASVECELRLTYVERTHPRWEGDDLTFEDWLRDIKEEADDTEAHRWRFMSRLRQRMLPRVDDDDDDSDPVPA